MVLVASCINKYLKQNLDKNIRLMPSSTKHTILKCEKNVELHKSSISMWANSYYYKRNHPKKKNHHLFTNKTSYPMFLPAKLEHNFSRLSRFSSSIEINDFDFDLSHSNCNIPQSIIPKIGKKLHLKPLHPLNTIKTSIEK